MIALVQLPHTRKDELQALVDAFFSIVAFCSVTMLFQAQKGYFVSCKHGCNHPNPSQLFRDIPNLLLLLALIISTKERAEYFSLT